MQNRVGRAAERVARARTPARVPPAVIGASDSETGAGTMVLQLRDEEDVGFGKLNE